MRLRTSGLLAAGIVLGLTTFTHAPARADGPSDVVVRVGALTVTAGELERMIANVPPFQLRTLGKTPEEIRKTFVDLVVVRELLLVEGAAGEHLADRPDVQDRIRNLLRGALLAKLRADDVKASPVSDADVRVFYDQNVAKFNAPARVAIWRILVDKREEAQRILDDAKKDLKAPHWTDLARERSLDKATSMRGGSLGFVAPDGTTAEPGVKVDAAIIDAVAGVKDGELVADPVREGQRWAVVWRRQSSKPVIRTLEQEAPSIRVSMAHERSEKTIKDLLSRLRKDKLQMLDEGAVGQLEITQSGEIQPTARPGTLPAARRPSAASPGPVQGPGGLR